MLGKTLAIILAGGSGKRLQPLTAERAKPAIPFGGKYRIIDFTLANCLESGIRKVLVLTQYKSHSLQKHLRDGWSIFNPELGEYITPVPPQMRSGESWYAGTADSVYQNCYLLERSSAEWIILLSGDHVYRMDYEAMVTAHRTSGADVTIACTPVPREEARHLGVIELGADDSVVAFSEKPAQPTALRDNPELSMVSMGIYVFSKALILESLREDHARTESRHDFGADIIPRLVSAQRAVAYRFGGDAGRVSTDRYWRDVGTLDAFYQANMDLLKPSPPP